MRVDDASPGEAAELLRPCCASPVWLRVILDGRPYGSAAALAARSDDLVAGLPWDEVEQALAAHPRIGDRAGGDEREAQWSRQEQAGATEGTAAAMRAANIAYEQRFGHVFLICATGRTGEEMLAECERRLGNRPADEQLEVRRELAAIVRLRLAKALA